MKRLPKRLQKLLQEQGVTTIYDYEAVSETVYLIETNEGVFKYSDTLYRQTRPRGDKWRNCQTGEVHRRLHLTKNSEL